MKTRIITAAVGLGVLAVVLAFFDTFLFDLVLSAVCLIAIHEVFSAMGFGKKQWYLYAAAVPLTLLVMLSTLQMVRGLLLPAAFLTVLFYNVCQIAHVKTLDFGKLTGFVYFSGVITFCFYSLIHLKRMLPFTEYRYDAIYFILLILCFAWGGDTAAYFAGRAFGRHKLAPIVSPHKTVEGAVGGVLGSMAAGCVLTLVYSLLSAKYNVISIQVQPKHYLVLLGMGAEGTAQTGGAINGNTFTTAVVLVLLGLLCMKLGFLAQDREEREGKGGRYGKITRNHARNPEYPEHQERGA